MQAIEFQISLETPFGLCALRSLETIFMGTDFLYHIGIKLSIGHADLSNGFFLRCILKMFIDS